MIRSLITQLSSTQNMDFYSSCAYGKTQPMLGSLLSLLREIIGQFQKVFIILDALDECDETECGETKCGERENLLKVIEKIAGWETDGLHILATSRKEYDIERRTELICEKRDRVELQDSQVNDDICIHVREICTDHNLKEWWQKYPGLREEIEKTLITEAGGM